MCSVGSQICDDVMLF